MLALKAEARLQSEAGLEPHLASSRSSPEPGTRELWPLLLCASCECSPGLAPHAWSGSAYVDVASGPTHAGSQRGPWTAMLSSGAAKEVSGPTRVSASSCCRT